MPVQATALAFGPLAAVVTSRLATATVGTPAKTPANLLGDRVCAIRANTTTNTPPPTPLPTSSQSTVHLLFTSARPRGDDVENGGTDRCAGASHGHEVRAQHRGR